MNGSMWGNQYRTTVVCIDEYQNSVPVGRVYNSAMGTGFTFQSTMEFLKKTDALLDQMKFPQPFSVNRVFSPLPTFVLRILFRQNASWQGSVTWVEQKQEESFRSVFELLLLMDSALCDSGGPPGDAAPAPQQ